MLRQSVRYTADQLEHKQSVTADRLIYFDKFSSLTVQTDKFLLRQLFLWQVHLS